MIGSGYGEEVEVGTGATDRKNSLLHCTPESRITPLNEKLQINSTTTLTTRKSKLSPV
jgi:hypothetical protein